MRNCKYLHAARHDYLTLRHGMRRIEHNQPDALSTAAQGSKTQQSHTHGLNKLAVAMTGPSRVQGGPEARRANVKRAGAAPLGLGPGLGCRLARCGAELFSVRRPARRPPSELRHP